MSTDRKTKKTLFPTGREHSQRNEIEKDHPFELEASLPHAQSQTLLEHQSPFSNHLGSDGEIKSSTNREVNSNESVPVRSAQDQS